MTSTRSARSATTPMSWVISRIAGVDAVAQIADQLEDLGLHGDVERGGRLVGDQQQRVEASAWAIIARCRCPPDSWCG